MARELTSPNLARMALRDAAVRNSVPVMFRWRDGGRVMEPITVLAKAVILVATMGEVATTAMRLDFLSTARWMKWSGLENRRRRAAAR